jgi:MSHA biogenesis protein MshQ
VTASPVDSDGVTTTSAAAIGSPLLRFGRLKLSNSFGNGKSALLIPVQAHFWSGSSWLLNDSDSCTPILATTVALSNYRDKSGSPPTPNWTTTPTGPGTLSSGQGAITLAAPAPAGGTGSVDVAINLGTTTADASCLASHPAMTAPALSLAYLRGVNGSCAASSTFAADPSATATFGVYSPETRKGVHVRELF